MLTSALNTPKRICAIIPCFKVKKHIKQVVESCPEYIDKIFVIDDCCPENSGAYLLEVCRDSRIEVIHHEHNLGVGGAMQSGYRAAIDQNFDIAIKIDGDGQMNPKDSLSLCEPILLGNADYSKGNRFFNVERINEMPKIRIFGNICLSFMSKISSGYWSLFDPNNGFTALRVEQLRQIPLEKVNQGYFFESDMLFRLNLARARIADVPMHANYGQEKSNLRISRIFFPFIKNHARNFVKRIAYTYFLRDFNLASVELVLGLLLLGTSTTIGLVSWVDTYGSLQPSPVNQVILVTLMFLSGLQMLLSFISYDFQNEPK